MNLSYPFANAPKKKSITRKHKPLIWENMLGTVYARNATGEVKYFDYDYEAAHRFAGTAGCVDLRVFKACTSYQDYPRAGKYALYGVR